LIKWGLPLAFHSGDTHGEISGLTDSRQLRAFEADATTIRMTEWQIDGFQEPGGGMQQVKRWMPPQARQRSIYATNDARHWCATPRGVDNYQFQ